jgi:hypothetical protein
MTAFLTNVVCQSTSQKNGLKQEKLFGKKIKQGTLSGILVGKNSVNGDYYYYTFKKDELFAKVQVVLSPTERFALKKEWCLIRKLSEGLDLFEIVLEFNKEELERISGDPSLNFYFEFYDLQKKFLIGGSLQTAKVKIKNSTAIPPSQVEYDPGFIISAPEELSIYLLAGEIYSFLGSVNNKDHNTISNLTIVKPENFNDNGITLLGELRRNQLDSLSNLMYIYRYCNQHLDSFSFFNVEGAQLQTKIDSAKFRLSKMDATPADSDSIQVLSNSIKQMEDAMNRYKLVKLELMRTKDKVIYSLNKSFLQLKGQ